MRETRCSVASGWRPNADAGTEMSAELALDSRILRDGFKKIPTYHKKFSCPNSFRQEMFCFGDFSN